MTMTATHFTAWLTTDPTCLDGANSDVTVLADDIAGYKSDSNGFETDVPVWTSTGDPLTHAVTTVPAKGGDDGEAMREAADLLEARGWRTAGDWETVPTGYIVTVERV